MKTTFIMGFTMHEKTPIPPKVGSGIQSCVRVLNVIRWGRVYL